MQRVTWFTLGVLMYQGQGQRSCWQRQFDSESLLTFQSQW